MGDKKVLCIEAKQDNISYLLTVSNEQNKKLTINLRDFFHCYCFTTVLENKKLLDEYYDNKSLNEYYASGQRLIKDLKDLGENRVFQEINAYKIKGDVFVSFLKISVDKKTDIHDFVRVLNSLVFHLKEAHKLLKENYTFNEFSLITTEQISTIQRIYNKFHMIKEQSEDDNYDINSAFLLAESKIESMNDSMIDANLYINKYSKLNLDIMHNGEKIKYAELVFFRLSSAYKPCHSR